MSYDARQVANLYLDLADNAKIPITNLHLQKILFFAQGHHLALYSEAAFQNPIEAWENGPVVPLVYEAFRKFGRKPISSRAEWFDPSIPAYTVAPSPQEPKLVSLVRQLLNRYGKLSGTELMHMTHEPGGPWDVTIKALQKQVIVGGIIDLTLIKSKFSQHIGVSSMN